tara:strand:- start:3324 stop:3683 length:360 start_codon:yes stop_codon:yes gene_type:complete
MLIDNKMNPFARIDGGPTVDKEPVGILNIETPAAPVIQEDPSIVDQGVGMVKDKALDVAMNKGTEMATSAATKAAAGAGKGGAAAGAAGGAAGTGLMAAAAPMAAPLIIGGLLATKLFK